MKFSSARKPSLQRAMKVWRTSGHFHIKPSSSTLWQNLFERKRSVALSTVQKYTDCQPKANYLISLNTSEFGNSVCFFCFSCSQFVNSWGRLHGNVENYVHILSLEQWEITNFDRKLIEWKLEPAFWEKPISPMKCYIIVNI